MQISETLPDSETEDEYTYRYYVDGKKQTESKTDKATLTVEEISKHKVKVIAEDKEGNWGEAEEEVETKKMITITFVISEEDGGYLAGYSGTLRVQSGYVLNDGDKFDISLKNEAGEISKNVIWVYWGGFEIPDSSYHYFFSNSEPLTKDMTLEVDHVDTIECIAPDSKITMNCTGKTKLAKDITENDSILYYNFATQKLEEGIVSKVYIHKNATSFVRYIFEDESYVEATDYHPIYTEKEGWKSYTRRNGYERPVVGDKVKTEDGWKVLVKIETFEGLEDYYDFAIIDKNGENIDNYFANGTLVQASIK